MWKCHKKDQTLNLACRLIHIIYVEVFVWEEEMQFLWYFESSGLQTVPVLGCRSYLQVGGKMKLDLFSQPFCWQLLGRGWNSSKFSCSKKSNFLSTFSGNECKAKLNYYKFDQKFIWFLWKPLVRGGWWGGKIQFTGKIYPLSCCKRDLIKSPALHFTQPDIELEQASTRTLTGKIK